MDSLQKQANLFKALMHPVRLAILNILREGEECVCHMEAILGYRQSYISQQLSVLRENGLVQDRREGWNMYYRVIKPEIFSILDKAEGITGNDEHISLKLVSGDTCPCPKCSRITENIGS